MQSKTLPETTSHGPSSGPPVYPQTQLSLATVKSETMRKVSLQCNITDVRPFLQSIYDGFENETDFQCLILVYRPPVVEHHSSCDELHPSLIRELC